MTEGHHNAGARKEWREVRLLDATVYQGRPPHPLPKFLLAFSVPDASDHGGYDDTSIHARRSEPCDRIKVAPRGKRP